MWWLTPAVSIVDRLRQKDGELEANLGYITKPIIELKLNNIIVYEKHKTKKYFSVVLSSAPPPNLFPLKIPRD